MDRTMNKPANAWAMTLEERHSMDALDQLFDGAILGTADVNGKATLVYSERLMYVRLLGIEFSPEDAQDRIWQDSAEHEVLIVEDMI